MSEHLEAMLRHAWNAGFEAGQEEISTAAWDVPRNTRFESYMESVIDTLVDPETEAKGETE